MGYSMIMYEMWRKESKKENLKKKFICYLKCCRENRTTSVHTYIHNWPFSQTYGLASHTTHEQWDQQFNVDSERQIFEKLFLQQVYFTLMVFSFLPKNVHFISENAISYLFLKNVSPSKKVICFNLNNLHFPMVEGIGFYFLYKSRVLIIPCKANNFCLFIGLPDEI